MGTPSTDVDGRHYIDGEWTAGSDTESFRTTNPATGETIATIASGTDGDVDEAVTAARDAYKSWRTLSTVDRAEYLWDVFQELRDRTDELGEIVTRECGKEISEGRADVVEAAHMVEWAAGNARHPHGDVVPSEIAEKDSFMRRKPRGVVASITPWNFPIAIPFWHMAISLVEGNTVVWKPAEQTPWCGQVVSELLEGLPDGVFNMVHGHGDTGAALVGDNRVSTVLFTGSATVGHEIAERVASASGKRAACEMGGKNAVVITEEADLDIAVHSAVMSSFKTTGQRCVSSERLIVHTDVYEEFTRRFTEVAESIAVGDPLDESTFMGPVIEADHREKIAAFNERAKTEGADVLVDRFDLGSPAGYEAGHWTGPFIYEIDYKPGLTCLTKECFGPHVALVEYDGDIERATELHNATPYGLAGAIISEDYRQLRYFRDNAELGLAYANLPCIGAEVQLPFGGVKRSGNGYPSARETIEAVTDRTAWTVNTDRDIEMAQGLSADLNVSN